MIYLVVGVNDMGYLEYNLCDSAEKAESFIKTHYAKIISMLGYNSNVIVRYIRVFEIESNYDVKNLIITKPAEFLVSLEK